MPDYVRVINFLLIIIILLFIILAIISRTKTLLLSTCPDVCFHSQLVFTMLSLHLFLLLTSCYFVRPAEL